MIKTTIEGYIQVPITDNLRALAKEMAEKIPENINNSIMKGQHRIIGTLGEAAVVEYFKYRLKDVSWDGDFQYDVKVNETRCEVKSKKCSSPPKDHYECSVSCYNLHQECDCYIFTRVSDKFVWILGYLSPEEFKSKSTFHRKGETDTNIVRGKPFVFKSDCYNIAIGDLKRVP
jgi:hypothetical protein